MKNETLKKLAFCEAFEYLFGTDEYSVKEEITIDSEEFIEWQQNLDNPQITEYKQKILDHFNEMH